MMKKKVFIASIIIIIIGIIVVIAAGFNVDLRHRAHKSIVVPLGQEYNLKDIEAISNEIFGKNNTSLVKCGLYEDGVMIHAREASDEQLVSLKNKLNEKYNISQKILIQIGDDYNTDDVKAIACEVFAKDDVVVEKSEDNAQYVSIEANLINEKELEQLNEKINEKYNLSNDVKSISASNVIAVKPIARVRLTDMAKQYILFVAIATAAVLVYFVIRYKSLGLKKVLGKTIVIGSVVELLFISIVAIARIPVDKFVVTIAFAIYVGVLTFLNKKFIDETTKEAKSK
ncbi:MAG: hypothetical protein IKE01_03245 [Clostridia bacterium]|nr:hypothetical protein [Clostridia bacterium]